MVIFLALIIADHVRPVESQVLDGKDVKSVPWANLKRWSDRKIFVQQMGGRLAQLLTNRFAERARSAVSGSVATLELRRSLAIACAKLDHHRAEQTKNEAME